MARKHPWQEEVPAPPRLPTSLQAEADALIGMADAVLSEAVQGRQRGMTERTRDLVLGRTLRRRCEAAIADLPLAGHTLVLRMFGQRLHAIGGTPLLEHAVGSLCHDNVRHPELRHHLVRAAWDRLGEHLA